MMGEVELLFSREVIEDRVKQLAAQVVAVYREKPLTVAVVLGGAFIFGMGQTGQIYAVCHGSPITRFARVIVLNTGR